MGSQWWYNPGRWDTWDGYAPYPAVWDAWATAQAARAIERLNTIRAIDITRAGRQVKKQLFESEQREAFGEEASA